MTSNSHPGPWSPTRRSGPPPLPPYPHRRTSSDERRLDVPRKPHHRPAQARARLDRGQWDSAVPVLQPTDQVRCERVDVDLRGGEMTEEPTTYDLIDSSGRKVGEVKG
jgi:hypothetical protein